ncbi:hypothetical protein CI109_106568 [Kwoniella shandongensis]|uniref:C2H2-type domain-containing protein n=1 Tax=Kwoniella shandongensis TaxID=1734106 RepID=A0A5M6C2Q2_9TREE|nr:uncharacterized protein CI109_002749 [Kwoniella shandongensis]KAA5528991.1 hypothetical protein CI109_002749 [Kwoniella shandongensis]
MAMSLSANSFSFAPFPFAANDSSSLQFPSPEPSRSCSEEDFGFDLDLDSFQQDNSRNTSVSPFNTLDDPAKPPVDLVSLAASSCSPSSINLVSPKSSITDVSQVSLPLVPEETAEADTAEALSSHHLQRYLHYKALAAKAEAGRAAALATAQNKPTDQQFDELFAASDKSALLMSGTENFTVKGNTIPSGQNEMIAYQTQQFNAPSYYSSNWADNANSFTYHPQSSQAALHNAQAQAHLQAADAARFQAQQQRSLSMSSYYMGGSARSSFDAQQNMAPFPRQSISTSMSVQSPPYPSTPTYPGVPSMVGPTLTKSATSSSLPSFATVGPSPVVRRAHSHESEDEEGEDELAEYSPRRYSGDDLKPVGVGMPIANAHGGGRGYVPGQTPDDPKKRHKCQICGRGFARAFNLKSHVQTHNPLRPKPYQCPHASCKRGFSRLHDLERHRQGIHSDGPLVEAKRQGVAPAIARAQHRMQRRAETGSLI